MNNVVGGGDVVFNVKNPNRLVQGLDIIRQVEPKRRVLAVLEDVDEMVSYDEHSLLNLFDGSAQQDGVVFLGTTNYLHKLPPRMLRTGRFDRVIEIGNPGAKGRRAYFDMKLKGKEKNEVIAKLVKATKGLNFSQMKELLVSVYALGYPFGEAMSRIKNGFEGLNPKKEKYLDSKLLTITKKKVINAHVTI